MPATDTAAKTPARIVIARAVEGSTVRDILRNGVLVGTCEWITTAWAGCSGKGDRRGSWLVINAIGHCHRAEPDTLAEVRKLFA